MSKTKTKRYLILLAAFGLVAAALGGAGTFASFTAETVNAGNTFATGTLLLHNTNGVTTCNSESNSGNVQTAGCAVLFTVPSLTDTSGTYYASLTLTNAGTVEASSIWFKASTACVTATNNVAGPTFGGGGGADLCANLQTFIIETDSGFNHNSTNKAYGCAYGTPSPNNAVDGLGCQFTPTPNLAGLPSTLTSLTLAPTVNANAGSNLSAGKSRYFVIGVKPPTPLTNAYQNRKGSFDLLWHIDQA
jgi:predicted ribosomally synthesized peptide with SipW-like signal peptide